MKSKRWLGVLCAGLLASAACSGEEPDAALGSGDVDDEPVTLTVRAERDPVTVNETELASGTFQEASPGDVVKVEGEGTAEILADTVVRIEALRGGTVTLPDPADEVLEVGLEVGHVFVSLDADGDAGMVLDAGERIFTTTEPGTSFALCQAPDGASCLVVLSGGVEWEEEGVAAEVFAAGEASFAARGNAPEPPRCADSKQISDMQTTLRGVEFAGALADIVDGWEDCPASGSVLDEIEEVTIPSAARMEHLVAPEATVGSPDGESQGGLVLAQRPVDGGVETYIEPLSATNGEFRAWLVAEAGDEADAWRRYAPQDWLDRAPGGAATQATYPDGTADEPARGLSYETAVAYCDGQAKRLPTEIEWEVAATVGLLTDLGPERQDWVSDWSDYGDAPEDFDDDRQVLRGNDGVLEPDPYYRVFAPEDPLATAARKYARVRCAASEVAIGGRAFDNELLRDDFNTESWPEIEELPFELDYHPENYHLDIKSQHGALTVVRTLEEPFTTGRIDTDQFVERNNTSTDTGGFRFGVVFGQPGELRALTIQPDEVAGNLFHACVQPLEEGLVAGLDLVDNPQSPSDAGRYATLVHDSNAPHIAENCTGVPGATDVPVSDVDNPVQLAVVVDEGNLELWVNDVLVDEGTDVSGIGVYGFYSETYHRNRTHIHVDDVTVSLP